MFEPITGITAIYIMVLAGLPILLMWFADQFVGTRTAIAIGFLVIAFLLFGIVSLSEFCNTKSICPEPGGKGACSFPCDSPGGVFIYIFTLWAGPVSIALLGVVTLFKFLKFRRQRYL